MKVRGVTETARAPTVGELGRHEAAMRETVERARREIPFYAEHHRKTPSLDLHALPTCDKADLAPFGRLPLSARPLSEMYRVSATSGTTGPRLFIGYTEGDWQAVREQYAPVARCIGLTSGDVLLNTHGGGLWIGAPSLDELAHAAGAGIVPCGPTGPDQVIEWLRELPVTLISATPSYMRLLAETAARSGEDLSCLGLRMGLLGGEGSSPALKRGVSEAFGAGFRWQELYGSTETGGPILAFAPPSDPFGGRLNVNTDYFVVELLRPDTDEPAAPGEIGELTLSTPYREGTVLIRYRTRDLAVSLPEERDASGWPRITALIGRTDDALKVRGALVYPSVIEETLTERLARGAEWRIEVDRQRAANEVITVRYEHPDDSLQGDLAALLHRRIGVRPVLEVAPPGAFERFSAKAARVVDRRER